MLSFCNSHKNSITKNKVKSVPLVLNSECPQDGNCTVEVLKNKSLVIKTDDLGGSIMNCRNRSCCLPL